MVNTQQGKRVKCLQSDNGLEYVNRSFNELLERHGMSRRLTVPYNPQQNGVAERKNRTLLDLARCLLLENGLPSSFWAEAVETANYLRNRCPSKRSEGKTPYELWHGKAPDVSSPYRFGCKVFVKYNGLGKDKTEPRSREGIFVGYSSEAKGYRVWIPGEMKVEIGRDVDFLENSLNPRESVNDKREPFEDPFTDEVNPGCLHQERETDPIHQQEGIGEDDGNVALATNEQDVDATNDGEDDSDT